MKTVTAGNYLHVFAGTPGQRREVAEQLLNTAAQHVAWLDDTLGYCPCPNADKHTHRTAPRDCRVYIDEHPHIWCWHQSCKAANAEATSELQRRLAALWDPSQPVPDLTPDQIARSEACRTRQEREAQIVAKAKDYEPILRQSPELDLSKSPSQIAPLERQTYQFLSLLPSDDIVYIGDRHESGRPEHAERFRSVKEWLALDGVPTRNFVVPSAFRPGVTGRMKSEVVARRLLVFERDDGDTKFMLQTAEWGRRFLRLRAVVGTGGKSLHAHYDWPGDAIATELVIILETWGFDVSIIRAGNQLCRLPGTIRKVENGEQKKDEEGHPVWQRLLWIDEKPGTHPALTPIESMAPNTVLVEEDEDDDIRPVYNPPDLAAVEQAICGSPIETYMRATLGMGDRVPPQFVLGDGILLGCSVMATAERTFMLPGDHSQRFANCYLMKVGDSGRGKGLTSEVLLSAAKKLGVHRIYGQSEAAIAAVCASKDAPRGQRFGLYRVPEVAKLLNPKDVVAINIRNLFLAGYDEGALMWATCPSGKLRQHYVEPFAPSLLVEGQMRMIEATLGSSNLDSGFMARFLVSCCLGSDPRVRKNRGVDIAAIVAAYRPLQDGSKCIERPPAPDYPADAYAEHMTDMEAATWSRLKHDYAPRIAAILNPVGAAAGRLSAEDLVRAGVIVSWFFGQSQQLLGLVHGDRGEAQRARMERYIVSHPGCTDRALYRFLHCSCREFRDISDTVSARGGAIPRFDQHGRRRWYPPTRNSVTGHCPTVISDVQSILNQTVTTVPSILNTPPSNIYEGVVVKPEAGFCNSLPRNNNGDTRPRDLSQDTLFSEPACAPKAIDRDFEIGWDGRPLGPRVAIDTETTMPAEGDFGVSRPVLVAVTDGERSVVLSPVEIGRFIQMHGDRTWIMFNAAFDFWVLAQIPGVKSALELALEEGRLRDAMLLDQLITIATKGNSTHSRGLEEVARDYTDVRLDKERDARYREHYAEIEGRPLLEVATADRGWLSYPVNDVVATLAAYRALEAKAEALVRDHLHDDPDVQPAIQRWGRLTETTQVKAAVALDVPYRNGLRVDAARQTELRERLRAEIGTAIERLNRYYAERQPRSLLPDYQPALYAWKDGAPSRSAQALQEFLEQQIIPELSAADRKVSVSLSEKTQQLSVSREDWEAYADHPFVGNWLEIERLGKLLQFVQDSPSVIHPRYQVIVSSGRTSCRGPNIQQLPRSGGIRECIVPHPGYVFTAADYEAIELRTLAQVCLNRYGQSNLAEVFKAGIDPHANTAAMVLGLSYEEFMALKCTDAPRHKSARQRAKAVNFGVPGGLGAEALVQYAAATFGVTLTLEEAQDLRRRLMQDVYPEIGRYLQDAGGEEQIVVTETGRLRGRCSFTQAHNTPFQGLAADGAKLAVYELVRRGWRVAAFVHDEVIAEIAEGADYEERGRELVTVMEEQMARVVPDVPIRVSEAVVMRRWSKNASIMKVDGKVVPWDENPASA